MPSTREYRRIFRRLFVTHLGLALLPLVALGIFSIDPSIPSMMKRSLPVSKPFAAVNTGR